MFTVTCGDNRLQFQTFAEAKAFAEKESWFQAMPAEIRDADGRAQVVRMAGAR